MSAIPFREPTQQLSIIVPVLDKTAPVIPTLLTLQPLRANGHEVILVGVEGSDGSVEPAEELVDQLIEAPRGLARQMNYGARHAWGEMLLFLHADCLLPDHADQLIFHALENSESKWGCFDVRFSGRQILLRVVERAISWRSRISGIAVGGQGMFMRRSLFEQVGGFPDMPLLEDIAMSRRLKQFGRPVCPGYPLMISSRSWGKNGTVRAILKNIGLRLNYFPGKKFP